MTIFERNRADLLALWARPEKPTMDDVQLTSFVVVDGDGNETQITETPQNVFGRFYVQVRAFETAGAGCEEMDWFLAEKVRAAEFFAENWDDRYTAGRPLLIALGTAVRLKNMVWRDPA